MTTVLELLLTIINGNETVNCCHRELCLEWDRILGFVSINDIFKYVLLYIFIISFFFFYAVLLFHAEKTMELYSGGHFHLVLIINVSLTMQKTFLNLNLGVGGGEILPHPPSLGFALITQKR